MAYEFNHVHLKAPDPEENAGGGSPLSEQLEEALREKDQFRAMAQRAQADLINYRKRAAEELRDSKRNAKADLLLKTLSTVDDLERALSHISDDAVTPAWREGLYLVLGKMISMLESEGVTKIDAVDAEIAELARLEVEEELAASSLAGAPLVPVSATTGQGLDALRETLDRVVGTAPARPLRDGPSWLPQRSRSQRARCYFSPKGSSRAGLRSYTRAR